jgi:hypothetical protein
MGIFRRDAREALAKARLDLIAAEAKAVELQDKRSGALAGDDIAAISQIDRQIETAQRTAAIHRDRIAALEVSAAELEREAREKARQVAIDKIVPRLAERDRLAAKIEHLAHELGERYFELLASGDLADDWPPSFPSPRPNFGLIPLDSINRSLGWLMFSIGRPVAGRSSFPAATNEGLGIGAPPPGLADTVADHSATLLELLRMTALDDAPPGQQRVA